MLTRKLLSSRLLSLRSISSETTHVLKPGDVLTQTRIFTDEDVLQYSKPGAVYVSQSLNFKFPVYIGDQITSEVQATNLRVNKNRYLAKFKTSCSKNGELLVLEGEAVAILQTLTMQEDHYKEQ